MPEFDYLAIDVGGREKRGRIAAPTLDDARTGLVGKKLYVVQIEPGASGSVSPAPALLSGSPFARHRMNAKALTLFTRQLATLVQVSPIEESLRTIALQTEAPHVQTVISTVHAGVFEGRRLADAMALEGKSFPPLYRAMVSAGESAGTLPVILERLAILQERQAVIRSKVVSAIAYPLVLTCVALFVVGALMIYVVPKVVEQFDTVGQQLPLLTRIVIALSAFLTAYWWALLIVIAAATFLGSQNSCHPVAI
jgi:general secretion pathway protein F